jgi:TatD DNase family protein
LAKKYIERGYVISVSGIVTFKNALSLHEAIKYIPLDKMLVETDGP